MLAAQSCLFVTPWTVAPQAPLSMEFSRQEYWTGLPFSSPGDLPDLRIEPRSPAKGKEEKERYTHLNSGFQRIARRDKKAFHSDQGKEIEENNRIGKTRSLEEN